MLILTARRIMPSDDNDASYEVMVRITTSPDTTETLYRGTLSGHDRADGWQELIARIAEKVTGKCIV